MKFICRRSLLYYYSIFFTVLEHRFFSEFCELFKNTYFKGSWTVCSETPVHLFKNTFFYRTSPTAASDSFRFPGCNFIKKETSAKMLFCEFCKIFKNIYRQNTSGWLLLAFICQFWEVVHLFYRAPLGNCLFRVQVAGFQPPDPVKKCFTSAFQAFYRRTGISYSKTFTYLKSLKIICEEVKL